MESWATAKLTLFPKNEEETRRMREFALLWATTTRTAESLGWKWNPGSIIQLYLEVNPRSLARQVFVSPNDPKRFLVRVVPLVGAAPSVLRALEEVGRRMPQGPKVALSARGTGETVVDVRATRAQVLGTDEPTDVEVERRLAAFVDPILRAIPGQVTS